MGVAAKAPAHGNNSDDDGDDAWAVRAKFAMGLTAAAAGSHVDLRIAIAIS